jgi:hypothetical protein
MRGIMPNDSPRVIYIQIGSNIKRTRDIKIVHYGLSNKPKSFSYSIFWFLMFLLCLKLIWFDLFNWFIPSQYDFLGSIYILASAKCTSSTLSSGISNIDLCLVWFRANFTNITSQCQFFGFHHQLNLVRRSVLSSSGSSPLPIAVRGGAT